MPVKRKALAFILIAVFAVSAAAWLSLVDLANADHPSPIPTNATATPTAIGNTTKSGVQIEDFHYTSAPTAIVGVEAHLSFNVTIHNLTDEDIDGLTLEVKRFDDNGNEMTHGTMYPGRYGWAAYRNESYPLGRLYANESRTITGAVMFPFGAWGSLTTVCVKSGDTVLAEYDYPPSPTPEPQPSPSPEPQPEPFPTALVIAASGVAVAIFGVGVLVYFKKRGRDNK